MGLSGPVRTGVAAGAGSSLSAFTAGPSARGRLAEEAAGALVGRPLSSEATMSGAAALRAGADFAASAGEGLGCAAVVLLAGVCGFETGCGCGLAAVLLGATLAGAGFGVAAAAGAGVSDIFA